MQTVQLPTRPESRRAVRALIPETEGLPYDQTSKVARFAAWVILFREKFTDPYGQISNGLRIRQSDSFMAMERNIHSSINHITEVGLPNRRDRNDFDLWAGALTAAVHTTSIVRSAGPAKEFFGIESSTADVSSRMTPALMELVMDHQDRLGDIKASLSGMDERGLPVFGSYEINPELLEVTKNGLIRFRNGSLDALPISDSRKLVLPGVADGTYFPNHGEQLISDIQPREEPIGCPISFMGSFTQDLLRASTEHAQTNGLI